DRVTKPAVYAEQGIPYFWRVDALDEGKPRVEAYALDPGTRTTSRRPSSLPVSPSSSSTPGQSRSTWRSSSCRAGTELYPISAIANDCAPSVTGSSAPVTSSGA